MLAGFTLTTLLQVAPASAPTPPSPAGEFSSLAPERDMEERYRARKIGFGVGLGVSAAMVVAGVAMIAGNLADGTDHRGLMFTGLGLTPAGAAGLIVFSVLHVRNERRRPKASISLRTGGFLLRF